MIHTPSPGLARSTFFGLLCSFLAFALTAASAAERLPSPSIETDTAELEMMIKHLTAEELQNEADRWLALLKANVHELNQVKIRLKRENDRIAAASEGSDEGAELTAEAQALIDEESAKKEKTLEVLADLREQRVKIIDRFNSVIDELSAKLGKTADDKEQDVVMSYRLYVSSVKGLQVDVTDTASTWSTIKAWANSEEGGRRLLKHLLEFVGIVTGFWILGMLLSRLAGQLLRLAGSRSQIMHKFVVDVVRRGMIAIGLLLGLAAMEFNITPLVAVIGAAGFVIAFALQDTLSNFASGLMIMLYRPFDIDDWIQTPDVLGKVRSMTLMTTNVLTPDNKLMVVPNNALWGKVITNITGSRTRRVDLVFGIGYGDDMDRAEKVIADILARHPLVLEEPEPNVRVSELGESSVNLICRPWVKTEDYWEVYWDVTRQVKERFDAEGISIPFPQRDLHIIQNGAKEE